MCYVLFRYWNVSSSHWSNVENALEPHPHINISSITGPLPILAKLRTGSPAPISINPDETNGYSYPQPSPVNMNEPLSERSASATTIHGVNGVNGLNGLNGLNGMNGHGPKVAKLKWLIYGQKGWIGQQYVEALQRERPNDEILTPTSRADDEKGIQKDLLALKPGQNTMTTYIGRLNKRGLHNRRDY